MDKSRKNTRNTVQQEAVLDTLKETTSHPTADELYEKLRKRVPHISLGTVYRNLEKLSSCDQALKLDLGEGKKRFDARMDPHYHFRCTRCGRVYDIPYFPIEEIEREAIKKCNFSITGTQIVFEGICSKCLNDNNADTEGKQE